MGLSTSRGSNTKSIGGVWCGDRGLPQVAPRSPAKRAKGPRRRSPRSDTDFPAARERSQDWLACVQTRISTPGHPRSDSA